MGYWLGVDLGTTRTAAAIRTGHEVRIARLGRRNAEVPSEVYVAADGEILIGEAADRRGRSDPGRLAKEFKRRVGDHVPLYIGGSPYPAHLLMARLLSWVIETVREQQGAPADGVTVAYPASWGPYKRELLEQVLRHAGVPTGRIRPEPVAAAIQHTSGQQVAPGEHLAVYDLGGGTFDVAVLRRTDTGFVVVGRPDGIEQLGGIDFDDAVFRHVTAALDLADSPDSLDAAVTVELARLRRDCCEAKESLSFDTEVSVTVALPNRFTQVRLNRSEFEDMIRPSLAETVACLARSLQSADLVPERLRAVLLTGGSARIPLVRQMVGEALRRPVVLDPTPEHSIALGAARPDPVAGGRVPAPASGSSAPGIVTAAAGTVTTAAGTVTTAAASPAGASPATTAPAPDDPDSRPTDRPDGLTEIISEGPFGADPSGATTATPAVQAGPDDGGPAARPPVPAASRAPVSGTWAGNRARWIAAAVAVVVIVGGIVLAARLTSGPAIDGRAVAGGPAAPVSDSTGPASSSVGATRSTPSSAASTPGGTGPKAVTVDVPRAAMPLPDTSLLVVRLVDGANGLYPVDSLTGTPGPRLPTTGVERPLISPDRRTVITIQTYAPDEAQLWISGTDGSGERPVFATRLAGCDRYLVSGWNPVVPDQIVLPCLAKDGTFTLRIVRLDGTVVHEFDLGGRFVDGATFAPDGRTVAFNSPAPGRTTQSIHTAPADGSAPPVQLTSGTSDVGPAWSPNGRELVFTREIDPASARHAVVVMSADGSQQRVVGAVEGADDADPAWSVDGRSIVFRSNRGQSDPSRYRFWIMNADGSGARPLLVQDAGDAVSTPGWTRR